MITGFVWADLAAGPLNFDFLQERKPAKPPPRTTIVVTKLKLNANANWAGYSLLIAFNWTKINFFKSF